VDLSTCRIYPTVAFRKQPASSSTWHPAEATCIVAKTSSLPSGGFVQVFPQITIAFIRQLTLLVKRKGSGTEKKWTHCEILTRSKQPHHSYTVVLVLIKHRTVD
jgi:hypothetical protein